MRFDSSFILGMLLLCGVVILPAMADEGFWRSRSIDAERDDLGMYCSLRIDADDRAYIAYYSDTCDCLKLAWEPYSRGIGRGSPFFAWSSLTPRGSGTGKGVSLWVNETGRTFAFSCVDDSYRLFLGEGAFRPATRDGFAPYLTRLEDVTWIFSYANPPTSLIRWRDGARVHTYIAYTESMQTSGLGIVDIVDCLGSDPQCENYVRGGPAIPVYRGDGHSAAYHNWGAFGVCWYNWRNGTLEYENWRYVDFEVVDGSHGTSVGAYCSLDYDSDGNPHISYMNVSSGGGLKYAFRNETGWHSSTIDPRTNAGKYTSLVIDANNEPHISYSCGNQLMYASMNGSAWYTQVVDRTPAGGTSIAVDSRNRPRIAYYDSRKQDLRYAWWEPNIPAIPFPR